MTAPSATVAAPLTGKARRLLRARGHHLRPVVLVGKEALSDAILDATGVALADHELVKVKLSENAEGDRHALAEELARVMRGRAAGRAHRPHVLALSRAARSRKARPKKSAGSAKGAVEGFRVETPQPESHTKRRAPAKRR